MSSEYHTGKIPTLTCYHCGEHCDDAAIVLEEKNFCCEGCKTVYSILSENDLCGYYQVARTPGISQLSAPIHPKRYDFLSDEATIARLVDFQDSQYAKVTLFIPAIHCSSCIWLLENLFHLNSSIIKSVVNFPERKVSITFKRVDVSLQQVVELLVSIGYEPTLNLDSVEKRHKNYSARRLYAKVGIAGFVFGNIMLLSFPEYLAIDASSGALKQLFGYLIILLSVPVFFYCSSEYFQSAYGGLKAGIVNIDIPLSLGIIAFYVRSLYEILSGTGAGYMDSFAGLIFFLLLGKIFQNKTFDVLNFERDYRSYFPISVTRKRGQSEYAVPLEKIVMGDRLVIRNNELIPADAVLVQGTAHLDYSFITGESETITKRSGELVYAGGIQVGNAIEITVAKNVEQSYLTQLWNESNIEPGLKQNLVAFSANVSRYFTLALLTIAAASFFYWAQFSIASALNAFSAVLIIACPCALALSVPFAFGNALRHLSRAGMFLKNINIIEKLSNVTTIIFDKTGTLTTPAGKSAVFTGGVLSRQQEEYAYSLCRSSTHPLSRAIARMYSNCEALPVENFREIEGDGIEGFINGKYIKLGRLSYIQQSLTSYDYPAEIPDIISGVHYSIDGVYVGYFGFKSVYREGVRNLIEHLKRRYAVVVLSGDTIQEKETLQSLIGEDIPMRFSQSPYDKLTAVQERQRGDETVLVIGDGLNDSGALRQADVGISVSEDVLSFSPASDSILRANSLMKIDRFLQYCRDTIKTVVLSFVISTGYNIFGLYYAVTGKITPFFAAVLMPLSSVTVIALTVFATTIFAKRRGIGS